MSNVNMWEIENSFYCDDIQVICGVDEAGRGPLAGPVIHYHMIVFGLIWAMCQLIYLNPMKMKQQIMMKLRTQLVK